MRNLVRIASVKSSSCFDNCLSSSSCFIAEEDGYDTIKKKSNYIARLSKCWRFDEMLILALFNSFRKTDINPFSFCFKSKIFYSHECFRNADISFSSDDFCLSSYDNLGFPSKDIYGMFTNDIEEDYIFHMRFAFRDEIV
jgi:hypothetical protein